MIQLLLVNRTSATVVHAKRLGRQLPADTYGDCGNAVQARNVGVAFRQIGSDAISIREARTKELSGLSRRLAYSHHFKYLLYSNRDTDNMQSRYHVSLYIRHRDE